MPKPIPLEKIPTLRTPKDFSQARTNLSEILENIDSLTQRAGLCVGIIVMYNTIYFLSKDTEVKEKIEKEIKYFMKRGEGYASGYNFQKMMLPDMFNPDKPFG